MLHILKVVKIPSVSTFAVKVICCICKFDDDWILIFEKISIIKYISYGYIYLFFFFFYLSCLINSN